MEYIRRCVIFVALLSLCACSGREMDRLLDIESFIQERPDSALAELQKIDHMELVSGREKALFSLLMSMAHDKVYYTLSDPEMIAPALSFYRRHKAGDHYAASLFYQGRISYDNSDYSSAIISLQNALQEARTPYWKAMALSHLGYTYNDCFNSDEELNCLKAAYEIMKESGDSLQVMRAMSALATAYHNNRMDEKADSLLTSLTVSATPFYVAFPQLADLRIKQQDPDYDEIVDYFETGIDNDVEMTVEYWCEYAYALFKTGSRKRSEAIFNQLAGFGDDIHVAVWRSRLAEDEGDYESALRLEKKYETAADSLVHEQLSQSVFRAQAEHYRMASELEAQKRKQSILVAVLVAFILLSIVVYVIVSNIIRRQSLAAELERMSRLAEESESMLKLARESLDETKTDLDTTEAKLKALRRQYAKTYQSQFAEIGRLFDYCNVGDRRGSAAMKHYKARTAKIIEELSQGEEGQKGFEERINNELDNIMVKLRQDFPEFKEPDFRFLSYVIVGFDATTRSILFNETVINMRVKKTRLLKKIHSSQSKNIDFYDCFMGPDR